MSAIYYISNILHNIRRLTRYFSSENRLFTNLWWSLFFILITLSGCQQKKDNKQSQNDGLSQNQSNASLSAQSLRDASLHGNTQTVHNAVKQDVDVNASDPAGRTALMLAAYNGHYEIVKLLLEEGANIDDWNTDGRTALIFAASGPFPDTVALLLKKDADPNATDNVDGWSALMFASAEGHKEVVEILLEAGADPTFKDKDHDTALNFARSNNHNGIVSLLEKSEE